MNRKGLSQKVEMIRHLSGRWRQRATNGVAEREREELVRACASMATNTKRDDSQDSQWRLHAAPCWLLLLRPPLFLPTA